MASRYRTPPESIDKVVGDLKARVEKLERLPRAPQTAVDNAYFRIVNGALRVYDSTGLLVVEVGKTQDGRIGVRVNDSAGEVVMLTQTGPEARNISGTVVAMNVP